MVDRLDLARNSQHRKNPLFQRKRNRVKSTFEKYFSQHNIITIASIFIFLLLISPFIIFLIVNKVNYSKFTYDNIDEIRSSEDETIVFLTDFDRDSNLFPKDEVLKNLSLIYKKLNLPTIVIIVQDTADVTEINALLSKYKVPIEKVEYKKHSSVLEACKSLKEEKEELDSILFLSTINIADRVFYACKSQDLLVYVFLPRMTDTYKGNILDRIARTYFEFMEIHLGI